MYARMPKGPTPKTEAKGFWARYRAKYMEGDNASFTPVIHLYIAMVLFGYTYQVFSCFDFCVLILVSFTFEAP
jgi:F-type H+-transporting ATPase subunit f